MKKLFLVSSFVLLTGQSLAQPADNGVGPGSAPSSTAIIVGTTTVTGGSSGNPIYDNAGIVGEMTTSGTGTVIALKTSPVFVTPTLGVATGTSLALGGCTIGTDVLCATGTANISGALTTSNLISTGGVQIATTISLSWGASRSRIDSPSDGVLRLTNNAFTDFSRLQLGGTTSSFPAIKRSSAALAFRLADDSADAAITAAGATLSGALVATNFSASSSNWTPSDASGAGVTLSCADTCKYARIGPFVYIFGDILVGANASATQVKIGGMPTAALGVNNPGSWVMSDIVAAGDIGLVANGSTNFNVFTSAGANRTWVSLSGQTIFFSGFYAVN